MCLCCCCGLSILELLFAIGPGSLAQCWCYIVFLPPCALMSVLASLYLVLSDVYVKFVCCTFCVSGFIVIVSCPVCMTFDLLSLVSSSVFISAVSPFVYLYSLLCDSSYACCVTLSFMFPSSALT